MSASTVGKIKRKRAPVGCAAWYLAWAKDRGREPEEAPKARALVVSKPEEEDTRPWLLRPWLSGGGAEHGGPAVRVAERTTMTAMEALEALEALTAGVPPGSGITLVEGPSWVSAEERESVAKDACAALGVCFQAVPMDGRGHALGLADDEAVRVVPVSTLTTSKRRNLRGELTHCRTGGERMLTYSEKLSTTKPLPP